MKKNKTYTVDQLNKMMMREDLTLMEIIDACAFIDICSCYEPTENPPKEQKNEWRRLRGEYEPEPTLENTSFYVIEPDGTKYFYCGNHSSPETFRDKLLKLVLADSSHLSASDGQEPEKTEILR